ncbi:MULTISPECIES: DUF6458 family protein [unclassified Streptomyces]|uniref:DUF6458 family protein n=1 Tax=unclassified Streptomyces TaxID=2593676 RepID=UPI000DB9B3A8|nr:MULTISPECIES: DUF6458 family protein [unclassified Streptomyces]MYT70100.1 hypothetical protein [Streptomyces sp. SID8367]RAJ88676.1 hypothetical protein K377_02132 [Streptomyces sp. PsTaAH-137]
MSLGGCIILVALGAILAFATDWHMQGVNLDLVGWILMIVGLLGLVVFRSVGRRRGLAPRHTTVVEDDREPRL